ncbi:MAG TPA: c-type cytochrome biogenesis protein CcsB [Cryptosporangiaceae bacterium]|nr:c-type cytochrome biogenesis protein CcsB [Cryptosporangiaceae bacterium]
MPVDTGLAELSNSLLVVAILAYAVAMLGHAVEYAFGGRGLVAREAAGARTATKVLAGAAGPDVAAPVSPAVGGTAAPDQTRASTALWFGRLATVATVTGVLAQVGCLTARGLSASRVPWGNMYEFVSMVCLTGMLAWLVVSTRRKLRYLGVFVLLPVLLLLGLAGTVLYVDSAPLRPALDSYWLVIHVSAASLAIGIFLVGFVLSVLYLVRRSYDKQATAERSLRFPGTLGVKLPAADALERLSFRVHAFAFPIWTFAIICGAIWAEAAWSRYWGWDPKETWAFITWAVYAAYLHARATAGWRGTRAVLITLVGWTTMMINLYVINFVVSGLHSYA